MNVLCEDIRVCRKNTIVHVHRGGVTQNNLKSCLAVETPNGEKIPNGTLRTEIPSRLCNTPRLDTTKYAAFLITCVGA